MKYFITYGDENYTRSAQRLVAEARSLGIFDDVRTYGPADLPDDVKRHPLMCHARGGGYWYWKPCLLQACLRRMQEGDILVYADAGCSVQPSPEWDRFFRDLRTKSVVAFRLGYRNKFYCRRSLLDYARTEQPHWGEYYQVMGGILLLKKSGASVRLVDDWRQLMDEHPEFVTDVPAEERKYEVPFFREHRHDQCVFNVCLYRCRDQVRIRWENVERIALFGRQAFQASRLSDRNPHRVMPRTPFSKFLTRTFAGRPLSSLRQWYWEKKR